MRDIIIAGVVVTDSMINELCVIIETADDLLNELRNTVVFLRLPTFSQFKPAVR